MSELKDFSVKIRNFKCFGESEEGFDEIKLINLIIGRNNSGKSSLLDLVDWLVKDTPKTIPSTLWHNGRQPEVIGESPLTEGELRKVFPKGTSGGGIPGGDHWDFGQRFVGTRLRWRLSAAQNQRFVDIGPCRDGRKWLDDLSVKEAYLQNLAAAKTNPFAGREFRRIFAERNIVPEPDNSGSLDVSGDGRGVTNIIQNFINKSHLPSGLVEDALLTELNEVFKTDAVFTDIVCQQLENNSWEIYLEEETKGRIPLSQSGSGLKTIIIVLVNLCLVPVVRNIQLSRFIFGFEELENNLHPALLRRLLSYIYGKAKQDGCPFFLTTHSNIEIDLLSKNVDSQIVHVTHDGRQAYCRTVRTYIDNRGILDDLDVRASDLLQSNGIIWVEGPSDRIYLNRWISLYSDGTLAEGNHFQCVFYGGRLLAHLSSENPDLVEEAVAILKVNRNSLVIIDSDKRNQQSTINDTKRRIMDEVKRNGGVAWITKGREIENYIPAEAVAQWLNVTDINQVGQYESFFDYLEKVKSEVGRYDFRKSLLAEKLITGMTKENIAPVLDLAEKLRHVCTEIRKWNNQSSSKQA
jgi:putative ATP-dependent endonuclease of the OLD family